MLSPSQGLHSDCLVPAKEKYEIHATRLKIQFSSADMYQFCSKAFIIKDYIYTNATLGGKNRKQICLGWSQELQSMRLHYYCSQEAHLWKKFHFHQSLIAGREA